MKKALTFDRKTLLLHNYYKRVAVLIKMTAIRNKKTQNGK